MDLSQIAIFNNVLCSAEQSNGLRILTNLSRVIVIRRTSMGFIQVTR
jgi:hypothetical protein